MPVVEGCTDGRTDRRMDGRMDGQDRIYSTPVGSARVQKVFKPIATGNLRDKNIYFESDRTCSMLEKIQTKHSLVSSNVSSSHHTSSYQISTSKLNEYINKYINKLTLPYFNFNIFCQPFHIPFFYNIFDQFLFCCYGKHFQMVYKQSY